MLCQARLDELDGKPDAALAAYQRVLKAGDRDPLAVRRTLELLAERRRHAEAYELVKQLADPGPLPDSLRRIGAELALQCRDLAGAQRLAQGTVSEASSNFRDHLWRGRLALAAGQTDNAIAAFTRARDLAATGRYAAVVAAAFLLVGDIASPAKARLIALPAQSAASMTLAASACREAAARGACPSDASRTALVAGQ